MERLTDEQIQRWTLAQILHFHREACPDGDNNTDETYAELYDVAESILSAIGPRVARVAETPDDPSDAEIEERAAAYFRALQKAKTGGALEKFADTAAHIQEDCRVCARVSLRLERERDKHVWKHFISAVKARNAAIARAEEAEALVEDLEKTIHVIHELSHE